MVPEVGGSIPLTHPTPRLSSPRVHRILAGSMDEAPRFEELCALEPALRDLEAEVRSVHDDGTAPFFCSNFLWLPLDGKLKSLIGTDRRRFQAMQGEPALLHDSRAYEVAYLYLSRLMPKCRECGCAGFKPFQDEQVEQSRRQARARRSGGADAG